jgi:hypothetical protein
MRQIIEVCVFGSEERAFFLVHLDNLGNNTACDHLHSSYQAV